MHEKNSICRHALFLGYYLKMTERKMILLYNTYVHICYIHMRPFELYAAVYLFISNEKCIFDEIFFFFLFDFIADYYAYVHNLNFDKQKHKKNSIKVSHD